MTENKIKYNSYENSFYINDDEGISQIIAPKLIIEIINDYEKEIVKLKEENKELQKFKDKVFKLIDKTIESETQIAENIESTIEGDYVKAVNRLTIIAFENLKKELSE